MIAIAALSGPLPKLGVIAVAVMAAVALAHSQPTARAWAALGALVLAPVLLLADIWHSPQLHVVHRHPLVAVVGAAAAIAVLLAAASAVARRPGLVAPLAVLTLPFRVPISTGTTTSNLLVPLYLVIAAASLAWIVPTIRDAGRRPDGPARQTFAFERLLGTFVVLYAVQALYSPDFEKALQQMVFFYVPFSLLFGLIRQITWDRELIVRCLQVLAGLAVAFACIGFVEEATKTLLLNPKVIAANDVHTYFTVNSVFFDPDIYGRYLALVMILLAAVLLADRRPRVQIAVSVVLAILWGGLVTSLSRSSMAALLVGLVVLAASRWRLRPVLITLGVVVALGGAAVAIVPKTFGLNQGLNNASSGRANLVSGGLQMFGDRPVWGYGSAGFATEYRRQNGGTAASLAASHTIPITVAAEQGLIGEFVYLALVIAALLTLFRGTTGRPVRMAVAAAFLGLLFHTMLYADFLEDPSTWTLLGVGAALATQMAPSAAERSASRASRDHQQQPV